MTESPISVLAQNLDAPMRAVNAEILARMGSDVPLVPQIAAYLIAAGGKRIRPLLTLAAAQCVGNPLKAVGLATAVEFIHSATLLHDDVVDGSELRRGKDAANLVFGNQASVLVGDFLFARAFELMVETNDIRILGSLASASRTIAEGEVLQLSLKGNMGMTMQNYLKIIEAKTAVLFAAACETGARVAGGTEAQIEALRQYGHHLGIAFQMADDVGDYEGKIKGKDAGDDFREGKLTLPVLLALEQASETERQFWQRVLAEKNQKADDFKAALEILTQHQTLTKSRAMAASHAEKAVNSLQKTFPTLALPSLVDLPLFVTR